MNRSPSDQQVTLSVVVPCFNEQATLAPCVESLLGIQDADLELIIVDDGSVDDSATVAGVAALDLGITQAVLAAGAGPAAAKSFATLCGLVLNFAGRKYFVFYEPPSGP